MTFSEILPKLQQGYKVTHPHLGSLAKVAGPKESVFILVKPYSKTDTCMQKVTVENIDNYYVHSVKSTSLLLPSLNHFSGTMHWELTEELL